MSQGLSVRQAGRQAAPVSDWWPWLAWVGSSGRWGAGSQDGGRGMTSSGKCQPYHSLTRIAKVLISLSRVSSSEILCEPHQGQSLSPGSILAQSLTVARCYVRQTKVNSCCSGSVLVQCVE